MSDSIIRVLLTGDAKGLQLAANESTKSLEKTGKASGTAGGSIKAGLGIGAGAAIAFGIDAVKAYMGAEEAQTQLETAIKNSGSTWAAHKQAIDAATASGQTFGYDQGQIMAVLAQMTTSFGSPTKALNELQLVENVAALTGKDLGTSAMLVTKGLEGQIKPLKALGLDLPVTTAGAAKLAAAQAVVAAAEANVTTVEADIHAGRLKGPAAATALATANDKLTTAQAKLATVEGTVKVIQDALTKDSSGAAAAAADSFTGKINSQEAAWRNLKIEAGKSLSDGLIKFQEWSAKTGRPEIMRLQGDVSALGGDFEGLLKHVMNTVHGIGEAFTPEVKALQWLFGSSGSGGAPVAPGGYGNAQHPVAGAPPKPKASASAVVVHVHSASPAAVIQAINTNTRRNGPS